MQVAVQQDRAAAQKDRAAAEEDRATLNNLAAGLANLTRLLGEDGPRGRSLSRTRVHVRARSEYHDAIPDSPIPSAERVTPVRDVPEASQYRSAKIPDPTKLGDGKEPSFDFWQVQLLGKFEVNADHFADEKARKYYVLGCTEGDAQRHLLPRCKPESTNPFKTAREMIDYLKGIFTNPHHVEDAKREYRALRMKEVQTFHEFKTTFLHLADEARIAEDDRLDDLYNKLAYSLQDRLVSQRHAIHTFEDLTRIASSVDSELRAIQARLRLRERVKARNTDTTTSILSAPKLYTPTSRAFTPARAPPTIGEPAVKREGTPASALTCFNCSQTGHVARDCPVPKRITDIKELQDEDELAEADMENNVSGNEDA
jgi:hypothetical protein